MTPAISRWLGTWPASLTVPMATERIEGLLRANSAGTAFSCLIEHGRQIAGYIGCDLSPETNKASLGYWLGKPHQHQGLMLEAAPPFVETAHAALKFETIEAVAQPSNRGSFAVMAACGLAPVGRRTHWTPSRQRHEQVELWRRTWPLSA